MAADQTFGMPRRPRREVTPHRQPTYIKAWRKKHGLSLEKLAEKLTTMELYEISEGQLSRIERGEQPYNQDLMEALATVLQCTVADLTNRGPADPESIWTMVEKLTPREQAQLVEIANAIRRTATGG
jgi:transcriptional regulator with XRE-family HTH domain